MRRDGKFPKSMGQATGRDAELPDSSRICWRIGHEHPVAISVLALLYARAWALKAAPTSAGVLETGREIGAVLFSFGGRSGADATASRNMRTSKLR